MPEATRQTLILTAAAIALVVLLGSLVAYLINRRKRHDNAAAFLQGLFVGALASGVPPERFRDQIMVLAEANDIGREECRDLVCKGLSAMVDAALPLKATTRQRLCRRHWRG